MMDPMTQMMMGKGMGKGNDRIPFSQLSRGKACIEFSSAAEASKAIQTLNGSELDGRMIKVSTWTAGNSPMSKRGDDSCKVYVANLAWRTRTWRLKKHFGTVGNIAFARVIADKVDQDPWAAFGIGWDNNDSWGKDGGNGRWGVNPFGGKGHWKKG